MKILKAKHVLPVSSPAIENGAVALTDGVIEAVGPSAEIAAKFPGIAAEDLGDCAILPGLVNCHSHLEITAMRGLLDEHDGDFYSWLITLTKTRAEKLSDEDISNAAIAGAIEGARAGVTCFGDIGRMGMAGSGALKAVGLRGIVFQETEFAPDDRTAEDAFETLRQRFERLRMDDTDLVRTGISPHSPYTVSEALFRRIAGYAAAEGIDLTIHASESNFEEDFLQCGTGFFADLFRRLQVDWTSKGRSAVGFLESTGVLESGPLLAHCVKVSDEDIRIIAGTGSKVAHCPKSNAKFGHGVAPVAKFLDAGIEVGLGSDSVASNNSCDLLEESRFAALFARSVPDQARFIDPAAIIEMATLGGARALGLADRVGSLEAGKSADLTVVSLSNIAQRPVHDAATALVFASGARDVMLTMVAGREIYRSDQVLTVDEKEIKEGLDDAVAKVRQA